MTGAAERREGVHEDLRIRAAGGCVAAHAVVHRPRMVEAPGRSPRRAGTDRGWDTWMIPLIYKIVTEAEWRLAEATGHFSGAAVDRADGYIHFSTAAQARETAARHFAGETGLLLVGVDPDALVPALRWEPSRGGALFPHLYGPLSMQAVRSVEPLRLGPDGRHLFPDAFA